MKKKLLILGLILILMSSAAILGGCTQDSQPAAGDGGITVTDMLGREVTLDGVAESAIAIGPGALRLYCYVADVSKLAGVEQIEVDNPGGRPYYAANPSLGGLPVIGQGGPANAPDPEKLLEAAPDVIFTLYTSDAAGVDELQQKIGIPVVALSYGDTEVFDPALSQSLALIGEVMGDSQRADEVVAFFDECRDDLNDRTRDIADADKPTVYLGAQSNKGSHGIESTSGNYSLFNAVNAVNVVDVAGISEYVMLDKEKILEWDPDVIILDAGGLANVTEDYGSNSEYYDALTAFQQGRVYLQMPYNYYYTNIDIAICNAYYIGQVLYPGQFSDIDIAAKADEIFTFLVGQPLYEDIAQSYNGGYGPVQFGE